MDRVLHAELVKRRGADELGVTTKPRMLELTAQGGGREDGADRTLDIDVVDVHGNVASVVVRSAV